jgi:hypothetical protein
LACMSFSDVATKGNLPVKKMNAVTPKALHWYMRYAHTHTCIDIAISQQQP